MGDYVYPPWGEALGFAISLSSMLWVPGYAIYFFLSTPGTWREVLLAGITPVIKPRAEALKCAETKNIMDNTKEFSDVEQKLMERTDEVFDQLEHERQDDYNDKEVSVEEKVSPYSRG
eukprot:TRINITY_DN29842_c0_g1_i1.p1 TRINITY_DN29842_c0_g1~~TRINITY_DN29842_c0_g1_i1.p1  ORF type:complete len:126 (+),score=27.99 TRINITY_DN29842_c0_g1_i1:25-378(+)